MSSSIRFSDLANSITRESRASQFTGEDDDDDDDESIALIKILFFV